MDPLWIVAAFIFGALISKTGLPPLVGYFEFHTARNLCPECPEPFINLGQAYLAKQNPKRALTFFEKGRSIQPGAAIWSPYIYSRNLMTMRSAS